MLLLRMNRGGSEEDVATQKRKRDHGVVAVRGALQEVGVA